MHDALIEILSGITSRPVLSMQSVSGGDINDAYKLVTADGYFFLKTNDRIAEPDRMFREEAIALNFIAETGEARVPGVLTHGRLHDMGFLVLEWIQPGRASARTARDLGSSLASLHQVTSDEYGWPSDNFIGSLAQRNRAHTSWSAFYINQRLIPQFEIACNAGYLASGRTRAFLKNIEPLLVSEKPSLLHGDLWSGNWMADEEGNPYLIDPAAYFGDREVDIALTQLFGGFDPDFYRAYQETYPLPVEYEQRLPLYQLYYLLVHLNLFGASYRPSVLDIVNRYSR